jgi:hypothetical protein
MRGYFIMMLLNKKKSNLELLKKDMSKKFATAKHNMQDLIETIEKSPKVVSIKTTAKEKPVSSAITLLGFGMTILGIATLLLKRN